jgi:hypothetical protein
MFGVGTLARKLATLVRKGEFGMDGSMSTSPHRALDSRLSNPPDNADGRIVEALKCRICFVLHALVSHVFPRWPRQCSLLQSPVLTAMGSYPFSVTWCSGVWQYELFLARHIFRRRVEGRVSKRG